MLYLLSSIFTAQSSIFLLIYLIRATLKTALFLCVLKLNVLIFNEL